MLDIKLPHIKLCGKCGTMTSNYGVNSRAKDGLRSQCRTCDSREKKAHRAANQSLHREHKLKNRYGMTLEDYDNMLLAQGGACAMCPTIPQERKLFVDHNHDTGEVRALLCLPCNTMLGMAGDSVDRLQAGIDYLKEHGSYEGNI
jgi:hypothetical protein